MANNQFLTVPLSNPDVKAHTRQCAFTINNIMDGKLNSTGDITLTASATTTTLTDARIGSNSVVLFMPQTANARTALNSLYVTARGDGSCTINHPSSTDTDQDLSYVIIG
jgi:hypothetical protein